MGRPKKRNSEKTILSTRLNELVKKHPVEGRILTQLELAQMLHVSRQTITYYLSGEVQPNWDMIADIARLYKVSTDWLLGLSDVASRDPGIQDICACSVLNEASAKFVYNDISYIEAEDFDPAIPREEFEKIIGKEITEDQRRALVKAMLVENRRDGVNFLLGNDWSGYFIDLIAEALALLETDEETVLPYTTAYSNQALPESVFKSLSVKGLRLISLYDFVQFRFSKAIEVLQIASQDLINKRFDISLKRGEKALDELAQFVKSRQEAKDGNS